MALPQHIRPIHPFPARMAPELIWDELPENSSRRLRVLDPMAGSGTTLVVARMRGHDVVGYDRDPLAVLIARAWLTNIDEKETRAKASELLRRARTRSRGLKLSDAYPRFPDAETKEFVRYWFDNVNRVQLTALSESISRLHDPSLRNVMWCAFSRLIITKRVGVSLASDVSHSRPHRTYKKAPINAFDHFERAVKHTIRTAPFKSKGRKDARAMVNFSDARKLPTKSNSVDMVITSPPYLNAIDYIRGHKFSLIWMGHSIKELRDIRATNVGTEAAGRRVAEDSVTDRIMKLMCRVDELSASDAGMMRRYVHDMKAVLSETKRVLRPGGRAVYVVGNCNIRQTFVQNSKCIEGLAAELGMIVSKKRSRPLPENRRYLPPPQSSAAGAALKKRMRQEVILTLLKP